MNFFGINPMKALVVGGIIQGFSIPPLLILVMLMTKGQSIIGERVNGRAMNILGWITTAAICAATLDCSFAGSFEPTP